MSGLRSFLPSQLFSVVRIATTILVPMAVQMCAPAWIWLALAEAARRDASATLATNLMGESVSYQRTVGAGTMETI